jgi:D-aspartate ligase
MRNPPSLGRELTAPLVVLGGSYNALSVARSLHRRGVPVRVLTDGRSALPASTLARSRAVRRAEDPVGHDIPTEWRSMLGRDLDGAVILPGSDEGLEFLVEHDGWLRERGYRPIEHGGEVNRALLDKERTHELACAAGVPAPRVTRIGSAGEARTLADEAGFPCAIKPVHSHLLAGSAAPGVGKGALLRAPGDVQPAYERLARSGVPLLLTEFVPGPDADYCSYYSYLDDHGQPLLHFTKRKPRQYPIHVGLGSMHRTDWLPDVAQLGLRMLQASGVRGIGNVEFKRDSRDGQLKLIECNLRLTAADDLVRRAGVDLGWLAYQRALGQRDQPPAGPPNGDGFRSGLVQWLPLRDLRALRGYLAEGELTLPAWIRSLLAPISSPVFRVSDPGPSVANLARHVTRLLGRR